MMEERNFLESYPKDKQYFLILKDLKDYGLNLTLAESFVLRQCIDDYQKRMRQSSSINIFQEAGYDDPMYDFFSRYFKIDLIDYLGKDRNTKNHDERMKELCVYINEKVRPKMELI